MIRLGYGAPEATLTQYLFDFIVARVRTAYLNAIGFLNLNEF